MHIGVAVLVVLSLAASAAGQTTPSIRGIIYDNRTGTPVDGVSVTAYDAAGQIVATSSPYLQAGGYQIMVPGPGQYYLKANHSTRSYVPQLWLNNPCISEDCIVTSGSPVTIVDMTANAVADFRLLRAGRIAGTVPANVDFSPASCVAPSISPLRLATGAIGIPYRQTFGAAGGTPPRQFHLAAGGLPPGLTLDAAAGVLSGTPTTSGSYAVTSPSLTVAVASGRATTRSTCTRAASTSRER